MATCKCELPTEFMDAISKLEAQTDTIVPRVLEAGGNVVLRTVREHLRAVIGRVKHLPSRSTGELVDALGLSPARLDRNGDFNVKVGFKEPRRSGKSNAMLANLLEYGKHGQKPRPFLKPAKIASKGPATEAMIAALESELNQL